MTNTSPMHDFRFQTGEWLVRHRKLRHRLVGSDVWDEFTGTCRASELLGGAGNVDDFVVDEPGGSYRAATFRRVDPETGEWLIYWADGRRTGLDAPMRGRFAAGVGTFFGTDQFEGKAIKVRFIWSDISPTMARWEQAFSVDDQAWEVNWVMTFERTVLP